MRLPVIQPGPEPDGPAGNGAQAPVSGEVLSAVLDEMHRQIKGALLYTHHRADQNTDVLREIAAHVYAAIDILVERGVIDKDQLKGRTNEFLERVSDKLRERGMGAIRLVPEVDKYTYVSPSRVNCMERLHVCRAACCRLSFALSRQDIREGVIQWDLTHPYVVQHGTDGFCVHRETGSCRCGVYDKRPVACRAYDCTDDERIWADFKNMVLNPELEAELREAGAPPGPPPEPRTSPARSPALDSRMADQDPDKSEQRHPKGQEKAPRPKSLHEDVETWTDACSCEPEPRWQRVEDESGDRSPD